MDLEKELNEEYAPMIDTKRPQTKSRGINDTQYFTKINGVYVKDSEARSDLADLEDYVQGISPVSLTATENKTYTAPTGVFGYSPVTVNVPTGAEIISKTDWDAMTTAQKQAKGLVAIQDSYTGFQRGLLVNGADYVDKNRYIPYSNVEDVACEASVEDYTAGQTSWGLGDSPVTFTGDTPTVLDNALYIPVNTGTIMAYIDKSDISAFTAYVVMKSSNAGNYSRLVSCMEQRSSGKGIMLYGSTINVSTWGNDSNTGISSANYFVGAITHNGGTVTGYVYDSANDEIKKYIKAVSAIGQKITIGRTDVDSSTTNAEPCDVYIKYIAAVAKSETDATIEANIANLYTEFLAE